MADNHTPTRLKKIALPVEHGGWGFLFEPIVLAMAVAPTVAGACFSAATIAVFLMRHPLKLFLKHRGDGSRRTRTAAVVALCYGVITLVSVAAAIALAGWHPVLPVALLSPLALVFLLYDTKSQGRRLLPELLAPLGLASVAPAIVLAAGWSPLDALVILVLLTARTIPSILYIRARLRLERARPYDRGGVITYHLIFFVIVAWLAWQDLAPVLASFAMSVLLLRASFGLSKHRRLKKTRQIGFLEVFFGAFYVVMIAMGYRTGV